MKRTLALLLALTMIVFALPGAAFAAADNDAAVIAKGTELSEKYGILIAHPLDENGEAAIAVNSLEILDMALSTVTPSVVRQTSAFYEEYIGEKLTFEFRHDSGLNTAQARVALGGFQADEARVVLFMPSRTGTSTISGDNPTTITHEFGHALHYMMEVLSDAEQMRADWLSFNNGIAYSPSYFMQSPDERIFITGYAAGEYEEDFAEVIGNCFIRTKAGLGFTSLLAENGERTGLGKKVAYADALLARFFPNDTEMLANFRKALSAPTSLYYQDMRLAGMPLQYIGFPQPRLVLDGMLNYLGKSREHAVWIRELGGWYVLEPSGNEILVFPGLTVIDAPAGFIPPG